MKFTATAIARGGGGREGEGNVTATLRLPGNRHLAPLHITDGQLSLFNDSHRLVSLAVGYDSYYSS